jgi:hypothetical protein
VGACKPAFLTDAHLSLLRVNPGNGSLCNVEDKSVLATLMTADVSKPMEVAHSSQHLLHHALQPAHHTIGTQQGLHTQSAADHKTSSMLNDLLGNALAVNNVFQGGHWKDLHRMLQIPSGEKVLYVGDHMFADIVRSKRTLGWRTVLIIPELEEELEVAGRTHNYGRLSLRMRRMQQEISEKLDSLWLRQRRGENVAEELRQVMENSHKLQLAVKRINDEYHSQFNPVWGQLLKAGFQDSRFGKQVSDYADLYTSRASNLGFVPPSRSFQPIPDFMSHDRDLLGSNALAIAAGESAEQRDHDSEIDLER